LGGSPSKKKQKKKKKKKEKNNNTLEHRAQVLPRMKLDKKMWPNGGSRNFTKDLGGQQRNRINQKKTEKNA